MTRRHSAAAWKATVLTAALLIVSTACTSHKADSTQPDNRPYYVSLGDSYATGTQPVAGRGETSTHNGFADQVVDLVANKGPMLRLENFGCGRATAESILASAGCAFPATGGPVYSTTQAQAAASFIRTHRADVRLVTVIIGGNDLVACSREPDFLGCLRAALPGIAVNVGRLMSMLKDASGGHATIVGLTYPEIFLGAWTWPGIDRQRVEASVQAFQQLFNPMLKTQYEKAGARFLDITTVTGGFTPLTEMQSLDPYGQVPVAVARVCQLTFYCQFRDVHARTEGYALIAQQIASVVP